MSADDKIDPEAIPQGFFTAQIQLALLEQFHDR
ncbi:MAG: hypothetical protein RL215_1132 [Planctomycetota bacterium]